MNEKKSQGNIICFRNLKRATDDAIALFSNKEAKETIFMEPYEDLIEKFNAALKNLLELTPTVDSVNDLQHEGEELEFVKRFRELMRIKNVLEVHADFGFEDLEMEQQDFEDFKSKYLDIYDKVKRGREKEKVSILDDVDFELELIHRDEVNVKYILQLLGKLKDEKEEGEKEKRKKQIIDTLTGEAHLRSKKELIEKFIEESLPHIEDSDDVADAFDKFWNIQQQNKFNKICKEENLKAERFEKLIENYLYNQREPLRDEIIEALDFKPKLLERAPIIERVTKRLLEFVETFISGMDN